MSKAGPLVIKIGGSTLGAADTTFRDVAALAKAGQVPIVVHGGGAEASRWLESMHIESRFERGLRVTDERVLPVVVAVFAGLVNKRIVAAINAAGASAVGLCGADGRTLECRLADPELGFVGEPVAAHPEAVLALHAAGIIPVVGPIGFVPGEETDQLVNINADTVAAIVTVKFDANGTEYPLVKMTLASGETLEYVDGSGWSVKSTGYKPTLYVALHADAGANFAMTNATNAERFALKTTRHITQVDLACYTQARLIAHVLVVSASVNTPLLRLRYYTSLNATFANYLQLGASSQVEVSVFTGTVNTWQDSGWIDLASGAKADGVAIAMCELGGDGAADPAVGWTVAMFR